MVLTLEGVCVGKQILVVGTFVKPGSRVIKPNHSGVCKKPGFAVVPMPTKELPRSVDVVREFSESPFLGGSRVL